MTFYIINRTNDKFVEIVQRKIVSQKHIINASSIKMNE